VQFLESSEKVQTDTDQLEKLLREQPADGGAGDIIEETWQRIVGMINDLNDMGNAFICSARKVCCYHPQSCILVLET